MDSAPGPSNLEVSKPKHEEYQYLDLVKLVINTGQQRPDRTGTGTRSLFAPPQLRFTLSDGKLPLITTKKVFTKSIIHELLWFLKPCTNSKDLTDLGVHIWDQNGSREFLDRLGFKDRIEGDLGPVYGFQWRHFGAKYIDCFKDYKGEGVDQLKRCIDTIQNNPTDRRIILTAWNPADLHLMALPPCHMFCQFYVTLPDSNFPNQKAKLSAILYQRSADLGLGLPFNITSYSLLVHIIAQVTQTEPFELVIQLGDAHVYNDHLIPLQTQLDRTPFEFPKIKLNPSVKDIDDFKFEDFQIEGYQSHPKIQMAMSA